MCTLTVVRLPGGRTRLAFNRDEHPTRPAGLPPVRRPIADRTALLPIDPVSGGTWIGVNDAGLAFALLNAHPPGGRRKSRAFRSRGGIVPAVLAAGTTAEFFRLSDRLLQFADYPPFRLACVGGDSVATVFWDGHQPRHDHSPLGGRHMVTSSGLGDDVVEDVRRELFDAMLAVAPAELRAAQDAFHAHRWPERPHLSVNMLRSDARTVSRTVIELGESAAVMTYWADPEGDPARELLAVRTPGLA